LRTRCLKQPDLSWGERGAILTLLGSAERAFFLIERIDDERRSVTRHIPAAAAAAAQSRDAEVPGALPMPA
jgi:phosphate:Na+ symporter